MRQTAAGDFDWHLEGRRKDAGPSADWRAVVAGLATPGHPGRGSGSFTIDFDIAEALDPAGNDAAGHIDVSYDLESAPATVVMDFETPAPQPGGGIAIAAFHYKNAENQDGSGDFQFSLHADLNENGWPGRTRRSGRAGSPPGRDAPTRASRAATSRAR